ncbi:SAD/SRA domain-containing protein [Cladophialophora immunda]|nr:SAD/SRA domain-containing protein [Cladophialophora immunda]
MNTGNGCRDKKAVQENLIRVPPDRPLEDEPFVTLQETLPIVRLLDQIPARRRMSMGIRHTFTKIQEWIRMMLNNSMTQEVLDESRILEHLKRFLSDDHERIRREKDVPEHIVEDLTYLYRKWDFGDLGVLARRGLLAHRPNGPLWPDPKWPWKRSADFFGHGHLVNGQTWCFRVEMMRDGAHAHAIAGISGKAKEGARSVVMGFHDEVRKQYYADVDQGETIYYYGTALPRKPGDTEPTNLKDAVTHRVERITKNSQGEGPTDATMSLFTSYRTGCPVRVFRSWRLAEIVPHRPVTGFRYDGLYIVTAPELVKIERQIYRFKMERMTTGQGPLRHSGTPLQPETRGSRKRKREA